MVTNQRESPTGKLDPDLVAAPSMESYMDQTGFSGGKPLEFQPGLLNAGPLALYHKDLILPAVLPEKVFPVALSRRSAMDHGYVFFHHGSFLYSSG